jgi:hypothetical protein
LYTDRETFQSALGEFGSSFEECCGALVGLVCHFPEVAQWEQLHSRNSFTILRAVIPRVATVGTIDGCFILLVDESGFDGAVDARENLIKQHSYYQAKRLRALAREFMRTLIVSGDLRIGVNPQQLKSRAEEAFSAGILVSSMPPL